MALSLILAATTYINLAEEPLRNIVQWLQHSLLKPASIRSQTQVTLLEN